MTSNPPISTHNQSKYHQFHVRCLSTKKTLTGKKYQSIEEIKQDAFNLYDEVGLNENNTILTYLDDNHKHVMLIAVPDLPKKGQHQELFLRFIHPVCAMCSHSFGILDDQLVLECSNRECGEQYCSKCVKCNQGATAQHLFACLSCRKSVGPKRDLVMEKHLIWPSMAKLYGTSSLLDLQNNSEFLSCQPLLKDLQIRLLHLQSRLHTFEKKLSNRSSDSSVFENLINEVQNLCRKLTNLADMVKDTHREMRERGMLVQDVIENYKKRMKHFDGLYETLRTSIEQLEMRENTADSTPPTEDLGIMNRLDHLPSQQTVKAIDDILHDVVVRKSCLSSRLATLTRLLNASSQQDPLVEKSVNKAKKKLEIMEVVTEELNYLRGNLRAIERYTQEYFSLLGHDKHPNIPFSRFIYLLEMLRTQTEKLEMANNFPETTELVHEWQTDRGTDDLFKPKIIELCRGIQQDLKSLFVERSCIYSIPYKIGVIGDTSVGKSALIMALGHITQFPAMVNLERSTFSYLQFDTCFHDEPPGSRPVPISFIDITGAIDNDTSRSIGNYMDLIAIADCDLYMIVFEKPFHSHNQLCRDYIENTLGRKCLLVRSKGDLSFNRFYQDETHRRYQGETYADFDVRCAVNKTRQHSVKKFDDTRLTERVFLTAAGQESNLAEVDFGRFDLNELKKELLRFASEDIRMERVCQLAILASRAAINTCFRRGYSVSRTKYRWLAAGASIIPFLDELPAFFAREKICEAFGIHDRSSVANKFGNTKNSFEEYLTAHQLNLPKDTLKSSYFQYLVENDAEQTTTIQQKPTDKRQKEGRSLSRTQFPTGLTGTKILRPVCLILGGIAQLSDDVIRAAVPLTSTGLKFLPIVGIVITAALTPAVAAWTFYHSGERMNEQLHLLCDDLQIILVYLIRHICQECSDNVPLPIRASPAGDSSSSDED